MLELPHTALHGAAPLAQVMPTAVLLVPSRGVARSAASLMDGGGGGGGGGGAGGSSEQAAGVEGTADIVAGAQAYVRAAVGLALGECASERGPTCIMGDARMARLYAEATAGAASDGTQAEVQGAPQEALADGADDADLDLYPDL